jgi:flavin-dependent dehydrogenase
MTTADVLIIGAGAAGLFCAGVCQQLGLKVVLLDHYPKVAEKIRISGGGRSNFTMRVLTILIVALACIAKCKAYPLTFTFTFSSGKGREITSAKMSFNL